jgi:chromosome segregation ATPase
LERIQFQNEAEQCRQELAAAKKTISDLQAKVIRVSRQAGSTPNDDEMASMKFAKEALETKLRKYAAHCQFLENEKTIIIDALKSVEGCDVHDGDISSAIVALCDKYSSLEEECEALMSAEKRASSYLSELDHLRESNAHLQSTVVETESKLERLAHSEAELTRKLNDAKEKVASLRSERDSLKAERGNVADLESEKARQVRYLEQENLQLMLDLKNAKKQIKSTRAQLDAMRMKVDDDTEDIGGIASQAFEAHRRAESKDMESMDSNPASPADKENAQENTGGYATSISKPQGSESARKRRFTRPTLSSKKRRNPSTPGRTVGLGEAGAVDDDHTGECKQS